MRDAAAEHPIDLVLPWVDGSDPEWQAEKAVYCAAGGDARINRYRDWDNLQYVFRGIGKYLPWVRTVHFVTWGHLPTWLNTDCPKLHIVNHRDYIPAEYLPVFSSHPIELNLHRIEGLAEQFIYVNDDMFFLRPQASTDYFREGLPVDCAVQNVLQFRRMDGIDHVVVNNLACVNRNFDKRAVISANPGKWFSSKYRGGALKNLYLLPFRNFTGFLDSHMAYPFCKRTFREVWEKEPEILETACRSRFRSHCDVNQWLMRYWQLAKGDFLPGNPDKGRLFAIGTEDDRIRSAILEQRYAMVCLSDDDPEMDFEKEKEFLRELFEKILPEKSIFER